MSQSSILTSLAEQRALEAENLPAFHGMKLSFIKEQITAILAHIGDNGIFEEYTKHDISHINGMLDLVADIIPDNTKKNLTPAEWLMIVLSIYFHDLGMLVTKDEYTNRNIIPDYVAYKKAVLAEEYGLDYKLKIETLDPDKQDRFLFQEYVRKSHGLRVANWIKQCSVIKGAQSPVLDELHKMLQNIDTTFLDNMAMVCQSHQEDDIPIDKFKVDQAYGQKKGEVVNLLYVAIITRTADLLHITSSRAPSIEFSIINPSDPISQLEWAKQREVKSIKPQPKKNEEGNVDNSLAKDTFEVQATFKNEEAFFAFTAYIVYAKKELAKSVNLVNNANKQYDLKYEFPWKDIDISRVEAVGFEAKKFSFELDQTKILDLLVGHTLYNDSTVVLRELTQNGIDATRLKKYEKNTHEYKPQVVIEWNSTERTLTFSDNGTGMDYEIIQNHLLKVGSSRYQDPKFLKTHPNFSSISRFGIGLLTCFLVADNIDIYTKTEDTQDPLLLKIRKIHGNYLMRYGWNPNYDIIGGRRHGTTFVLHIRQDIDMSNVENDLKKWIIVPESQIIFKNDGIDCQIGETNSKTVLLKYLSENGYPIDNKQYKIYQYNTPGFELSFLVKYHEYLQQWLLVNYESNDSQDEETIPIGICIEGIRVNFRTPGYSGRKYFALCNCIGENAPKTNVARTNIENTKEQENMLKSIYDGYLAHINEQVQRLSTTHSISWAANEANYAIGNLTNYGRGRSHTDMIRKDIFNKCLMEIPCWLVEDTNDRSLRKMSEITEFKHFWTIESYAYISADNLLKDTKATTKSALFIMDSLVGQNSSKHIDHVLCNTSINRYTRELLYDSYEVVDIKVNPNYRRLDLCWSIINDGWYLIDYGRDESKFFLQKSDSIFDIDDKNIKSQFGIYLLKGTELHKFLFEKYSLYKSDSIDSKRAFYSVLTLFSPFFNKVKKGDIRKAVNQFWVSNDNMLGSRLTEYFTKEELIDLIERNDFSIYNPKMYYRNDW